MIDGLAALGPLSFRPAAGWSDPGMGAAAPAGGAGAASFTEVLGAAGAKALDTMRGAETASLTALQGEADARTVVDAVMRAEQTLQTAVAIRDKIVSAYLEISRMQI
jgi:flagellar hook-basal body complex protein FliE